MRCLQLPISHPQNAVWHKIKLEHSRQFDPSNGTLLETSAAGIDAEPKQAETGPAVQFSALATGSKPIGGCFLSSGTVFLSFSSRII